MKTAMGLLLLLGVAIQRGLAGKCDDGQTAGGKACGADDVCCVLAKAGEAKGECHKKDECEKKAAENVNLVCAFEKQDDQSQPCTTVLTPESKGKCNDGKKDVDCLFSTCCKIDVKTKTGKCSTECGDDKTQCPLAKDKVCKVPAKQLGECKKDVKCGDDAVCCLLDKGDGKKCGKASDCNAEAYKDGKKKCTFDLNKDGDGFYKAPCTVPDTPDESPAKKKQCENEDKCGDDVKCCVMATGKCGDKTKCEDETDKSKKCTFELHQKDGKNIMPCNKDDKSVEGGDATPAEKNQCKNEAKCGDDAKCCVLATGKCGNKKQCDAVTDKKKKCTFELHKKDGKFIKPCDKNDDNPTTTAAPASDQTTKAAATAAGTGSLIAGLLLLLPIINHN